MHLPLVLPALLQKNHETTLKLRLKVCFNLWYNHLLFPYQDIIPPDLPKPELCSIYLNRNLPGKLPLFNLHYVLK